MKNINKNHDNLNNISIREKTLETPLKLDLKLRFVNNHESLPIDLKGKK